MDSNTPKYRRLILGTKRKYKKYLFIIQHLNQIFYKIISKMANDCILLRSILLHR